MARTEKQRATLDALGVRIVEMKGSATTQVPAAWNKEQAELLPASLWPVQAVLPTSAQGRPLTP